LHYGQPIEISVDASGEAAGAMVVQNGKIVRIFSKKFNKSQSTYNTTRREALALLWAVLRFRHLMTGLTVVWTDHQPLERIFQGNGEVLDLLLRRWLEILQEHTIVVKYKKGSENGIADYLSRNAAQGIDTFVSESEILRYLNRGDVSESDFSDAVKKKSRRYESIDGSLYLKVGSDSFPVPPQENRLEWLTNLHNELGHPSHTGFLSMLRPHWRWESMPEDVQRVQNSCLGCAYGGAERPEEKSDWIQSRSSWRLFDEISMDLITKLPTTKRGMSNLLVITEAISGWPEAYPLKSKTAQEVGGCIFHYFSQYLVPRRIRSDRGGEFMNDVLQMLREVYHFDHINSSSRHPQGDGQVERRNQDIISNLEKGDMEDWDIHIANVLTGIRIRPTIRTGLSPYEILFCQSPRLPLDLKFRSQLSELPTRVELMDKINMERFISARSEIHRDQWKKIKEKMKDYELSRLSGQAKFAIGELVMIRNKKRKKGDAKWLGPYVVVKHHAKGVMVKLLDGKIMPYHDSDVKRFKFPFGEASGGVSVRVENSPPTGNSLDLVPSIDSQK
jgi:hypothetical protein